MKPEELRLLAEAWWRQSLRDDPGMSDADAAALWEDINDEIHGMPPDEQRAAYDETVGSIPQLAGEVGRAPGSTMDSTEFVRRMFSMDPDSANALLAGSGSVSGQPAQSRVEMPASRRASMEASPTGQMMRIPGMTLDRAMSMPRSRQDAIMRSDQMNVTARGDGTVRDLGRMFGDAMRKRGRMAEDMDEMGVSGLNRFGAGGLYGLAMAPHRIIKGVTGVSRLMPGSGGALYEPYSRATAGFDRSYEHVTPALGKAGMGGEMFGSLPTEMPLYASGTKAIEALPLLQRMIAGGRTMGAIGRTVAGAGIDAAQGALTEAGERDPSLRGLATNVGVNVGLGAPLNLGMEGLGAMFGRSAPTPAEPVARPQSPAGPPIEEGAIGRMVEDIMHGDNSRSRSRNPASAFELLDENILPRPRRQAMTSPAPATFDLLDDAPPKYNKLLSEMARQGRPRTHGYMVPEY